MRGHVPPVRVPKSGNSRRPGSRARPAASAAFDDLEFLETHAPQLVQDEEPVAEDKDVVDEHGQGYFTEENTPVENLDLISVGRPQVPVPLDFGSGYVVGRNGAGRYLFFLFQLAIEGDDPTPAFSVDCKAAVQALSLGMETLICPPD